MTKEQQELLIRINAYSETALKDIDPQKTPISFQLEKLRPIMEEIAKEKNVKVEEIFIQYMDLASEAAVNTDNRMRDSLSDLNDGNGTPILYR